MGKRSTKPPGQEHWTWREIDGGSKLSRGQRSAAHRHDVMKQAGPGWYALYVAVLIVGVVIAIFSGKH